MNQQPPSAPAPVKAFLSFSGRDLAYIRPIFAELIRQGVEIWDYSDLCQEIELGKPIPDELFARIADCDYFIVVLSRNSTGPATSHFTALEMRHALDCGLLQRQRLIPVILTPWPPDYSSLQEPFAVFRRADICHIDIGSPRDPRSFLAAIERICRQMGVTYEPKFTEHPRLPFFEYFVAETLDLLHKNAAHVRLSLILGEFNRRLARDQWGKASFLIGHFLSTARHEIPRAALFYPWLVKGICQLQLGRLPGAEESFREAIATLRKWKDPVADARDRVHAYSCLGQVYLARGLPARAERYFKLTLRRARLLGNDLTILDTCFNLAVCCLYLNRPIPETYAGPVRQGDPARYPPDLRVKFLRLKAWLLQHEGGFEEALSAWAELEALAGPDETAAIESFECRLALRRPAAALEALLLFIHRAREKNRPCLGALQRLANDYFGRGEYAAAARIYEDDLLHAEPDNREYMVMLAKCAWGLGDPNKTRALCRRILGAKTPFLPRNPDEFYFAGFAQFLLGQEQKALYDYERSGKTLPYYSTLLR